MDDSRCPHCSTRLSRARFRPGSVLLYGALATMLAFVVAFLIVPVAIVGSLVALFAREKTHIVRFEEHGSIHGDNS